MKILHLIDIPWWSGLSSYALESAKAQKDAGHRVLFLSEFNSLPTTKARKHKIPVAGWGGRKLVGTILNFFILPFYIFKFLPQRLIAHTGTTHTLAIFWGWLFQIPVLRTRSSAQMMKRGMFSHWTSRRTWKFVLASQHLKTLLLYEYEPKSVVLYPPVTIPKLNQDSRPDSQNIRLGILARLDPVKGHKYLIEAVSEVQKEFPNIELSLAGSEENIRWHQLSKKAKECGVNRIVYNGFLTKQQVFNWMRSCDIGIIASTHSEEVSRALMEWMALGKPVVATRVGSISEILGNSSGGIIVEPSQSQGLKQAIISLIKRQSEWKKMGEDNYLKVKEKYNPLQFQKRWDEVLK